MNHDGEIDWQLYNQREDDEESGLFKDVDDETKAALDREEQDKMLAFAEPVECQRDALQESILDTTGRQPDSPFEEDDDTDA